MVGKRSATQGHPAAGPSAKQAKKAYLSMFWWVGEIQRCHRSLFPRRTRPVFARIGRFFRPFSSVFCTECANPLRWVHRWVGEATIIPMVTLSTRPPSSSSLLLVRWCFLLCFSVCLNHHFLFWQICGRSHMTTENYGLDSGLPTADEHKSMVHKTQEEQ